jgi:hypothetical protein
VYNEGKNNLRWKEKIKCTCRYCGKQFEIVPSRIKKGRGKFCSKKCRNDWDKSRRIKRICKYCGKSFELTPHKIHNELGKYCSRACADKGKVKFGIVAGSNHPNWKRIKKTCEKCGKTFETYPNIIEYGNGKFCSEECYYKSKRRRIKRICENCGREFEAIPCIVREGYGKYCGIKCKSEAFGKNQWKENNPMWNGGTVPNFGYNWKKQRKKALKNADYRCEITFNDDVLVVHHIISRRSCHIKFLEICYPNIYRIAKKDNRFFSMFEQKIRFGHKNYRHYKGIPMDSIFPKYFYDEVNSLDNLFVLQRNLHLHKQVKNVYESMPLGFFDALRRTNNNTHHSTVGMEVECD